MKKIKHIQTTILFLWIATTFCFSQQAQSFSVEGKIEGLSSGKLYLVSQTSQAWVDTLGQAPFHNAAFSLQGTLSEPRLVYIMVEGYQGGFPFFAEPGENYRALLKNDAGAFVRGGKLQNAWLNYRQRADSIQLRIQEATERYEAMKRENRFRSASKLNDSLQTLRNEYDAALVDFLAQQNNLIAAYMTYTDMVAKEKNPEESLRMYESLSADAQNSSIGRMIKERIDRIAKTETGKDAPDFTLPNLQGEPVTLSQVKGKIKILDFWASWCGPCRLNNPKLKKLYDKYHYKGLEIIGISLDDRKSSWENAVAKDALPWINLSSLKGWECSVAHRYNITGIPAVFILDENNRIIASGLREKKLEEFLEKTFGNP